MAPPDDMGGRMRVGAVACRGVEPGGSGGGLGHAQALLD